MAVQTIFQTSFPVAGYAAWDGAEQVFAAGIAGMSVKIWRWALMGNVGGVVNIAGNSVAGLQIMEPVELSSGSTSGTKVQSGIGSKPALIIPVGANLVITSAIVFANFHASFVWSIEVP